LQELETNPLLVYLNLSYLPTGLSNIHRPFPEGNSGREDLETMYCIINEAATAYKNVIPADQWKDPYMSKTELQHEIKDGVTFWCYEREKKLVGIMGIQHVKDVSLIRHAYVRKTSQNQGVGTKLLAYLCNHATRPVLVGTWAAATWAIHFYESHGFTQVTEETKNRLLRTFWSIPERQVETSVVLAN
jgi:N-acetylglutamate synthase-like GNAT family acetyltransferase